MAHDKVTKWILSTQPKFVIIGLLCPPDIRCRNMLKFVCSRFDPLIIFKITLPNLYDIMNNQLGISQSLKPFKIPI